MASKIQIKRGMKASMPALSPGEFGLATDTKELFIGTANGNLQLSVLDDNGKLPSGQVDLSGYVPTSRTVNGHALTGNVTLDANDVGTLPENSILSVATKTKYGLGSEAVPDDVLAMLAGSLKVAPDQVLTKQIFKDWSVTDTVPPVGGIVLKSDGVSKIFGWYGTHSMRSSDGGKTWSTRSISNYNFNNMVNGKVFIRDTYALQVSDDLGETFDACKMSHSSVDVPSAITYFDGVYYGTATIYSGNFVYWYSTDAVNWTRASVNNSIGNNGLHRILNRWWTIENYNMYYTTGDVTSSQNVSWSRFGSYGNIYQIFEYNNYMYFIQQVNQKCYVYRFKDISETPEKVAELNFYATTSSTLYPIIFGNTIIVQPSSGPIFAVSNDGETFEELSVDGTSIYSVTMCGDTAFATTANTSISQKIQTSKNEYGTAYTLQTPTGTNVTDQVAQALGSVKVETGSYIGTETNGSSNPNTLTFSGSPILVWFFATKIAGSSKGPWDTPDISFDGHSALCTVPMWALGTDFAVGPPYIAFGTGSSGNQSGYSKKSPDGKTLSWYNTEAPVYQLNSNTYEYFYIAFIPAGGDT